MKDKTEIHDFGGHSQKELVQLLQAYRQAIDESLISSITDTKGRIIYANKNFCEITNYSEEELIGKDHRIINSEYHPKEFFKKMWETIVNGDVWHDEIRNKSKNGTFYWVDTVILPIRDDMGNTIQYLSLRMLIDDKKRAEVERKEYVKSLEDMLFMTNHEVRQPIANCLGLISIIEDSNPSKEDLIKIYDHIKLSATKLDAFTRKLTLFMHDLKEAKTNKNNG